MAPLTSSRPLALFGLIAVLLAAVTGPVDAAKKAVRCQVEGKPCEGPKNTKCCSQLKCAGEGSQWYPKDEYDHDVCALQLAWPVRYAMGHLYLERFRPTMSEEEMVSLLEMNKDSTYAMWMQLKKKHGVEVWDNWAEFEAECESDDCGAKRIELAELQYFVEPTLEEQGLEADEDGSYGYEL
mmetsp:Transcript_89012/g.254339  ORF Transcript_89012/g.254339 Transcript_89012/m.254339 type:complete len:182 (-) Transcript_89012:202-747(-)